MYQHLGVPDAPRRRGCTNNYGTPRWDNGVCVYVGRLSPHPSGKGRWSNLQGATVSRLSLRRGARCRARVFWSGRTLEASGTLAAYPHATGTRVMGASRSTCGSPLHRVLTGYVLQGMATAKGEGGRTRYQVGMSSDGLAQHIRKN